MEPRIANHFNISQSHDGIRPMFVSNGITEADRNRILKTVAARLAKRHRFDFGPAEPSRSVERRLALSGDRGAAARKAWDTRRAEARLAGLVKHVGLDRKVAA
jgi:hypothetical protein